MIMKGYHDFGNNPGLFERFEKKVEYAGDGDDQQELHR